MLASCWRSCAVGVGGVVLASCPSGLMCLSRGRNTASLSGVYPKTVNRGDAKLAGEPPLNVHKPLLERSEFAWVGLVMTEHPG